MNTIELEIYRTFVRSVIECPYCFADKGEACQATAFDGITADVDYVHDDRSFAYHELVFSDNTPVNFAGEDVH